MSERYVLIRTAGLRFPFNSVVSRSQLGMTEEALDDFIAHGHGVEHDTPAKLKAVDEQVPMENLPNQPNPDAAGVNDNVGDQGGGVDQSNAATVSPRSQRPR